MRNKVNLWALAGLVLTVASAGMVRRGDPPILPDPSKTPGDTLPVTKDDICQPGYSKKVRNVPIAVKNEVYAAYGIGQHAPGEFEIDHLISLELGGSNSKKNLWPQSYKTSPWNAHVKDALENELHKEVCSGKLDLKIAQKDIAANWIEAYKKYFHTDLPKSKMGGGKPTGGTGAAPGPTSGAGQVWVNTKSGKYFRPGDRYYGKTKEGKYLSEAEATKQGYTAAK